MKKSIYVESQTEILELCEGVVTYFGDKGFGFFKARVGGEEERVFFHISDCGSFSRGLFCPKVETFPSGRYSPDPKEGDTILFLGTIEVEHRPGKGEVFNVKRWWRLTDYERISRSGGTMIDGNIYGVREITMSYSMGRKNEPIVADIFEGSLEELHMDFPRLMARDKLRNSSRQLTKNTIVKTEFVFLLWDEKAEKWGEIPDPRRLLGDGEMAKIAAYRGLKNGTTSVVPGPKITIQNLRAISATMVCEGR